MSEDAFPTADAADAAEQARPVAAEDADEDAARGATAGARGSAAPLGEVDAAEADVLEQRAEAGEDDEDGYRA